MTRNVSAFDRISAFRHNPQSPVRSWSEVCKARGLDFYVFKSQLKDGLGRLIPSWGTFAWPLDAKAAGDKYAARFLANVGADYGVVQHINGFQLADALIAHVPNAYYSAAGVLDEGATVWGEVTTGKFNIGNDIYRQSVIFSTAHGGNRSWQLRTQAERQICSNGMMAAVHGAASSWRVRHTKNAQARVEVAQRDILRLQDTAERDINTLRERLEFLSGRRVTRESMTTVLDRVFPMTADSTGQLRSSTRRNNILAEVLRLYELNDGNAFPEQRGSGLNLLNAVTEYTDHYRSASNPEARAEAALFGSGNDLKGNALDIILAEAERMPAKLRPVEVASFAEIGLNVPEVGR